MIIREINKSIFNIYMLIALSIGTALAVGHHLMYTLFQVESLNFIGEMQGYEDYYGTFNFYALWMNAGGYSVECFIFYLSLPIIAILPYGISYYSEKKSGYLKNMAVRVDYKKILKSKSIATFLSGGIAIAIPEVVSLMLSASVLPNFLPLPGSGLYGENSFMLYSYYYHPLLYSLVYIAINFVIAGLFACLAVIVGDIVKYGFLVYIIPTIIYLFCYSLFSFMGLDNLAPIQFLNAGTSNNRWQYFVIYAVALLGVITTFLLIKGKKRDVL